MSLFQPYRFHKRRGVKGLGFSNHSTKRGRAMSTGGPGGFCSAPDCRGWTWVPGKDTSADDCLLRHDLVRREASRNLKEPLEWLIGSIRLCWGLPGHLAPLEPQIPQP